MLKATIFLCALVFFNRQRDKGGHLSERVSNVFFQPSAGQGRALVLGTSLYNVSMHSKQLEAFAATRQVRQMDR
jgi:hypothetical protein